MHQDGILWSPPLAGGILDCVVYFFHQGHASHSASRTIKQQYDTITVVFARSENIENIENIVARILRIM